MFKSSDYSEGWVCKKCGELLGTIDRINVGQKNGKYISKEEIFCRNCQSNTCVKVALPYVLRYLTNELAAMNIKLSFGVEEKQGLE